MIQKLVVYIFISDHSHVKDRKEKENMTCKLEIRLKKVISKPLLTTL